MVLAERWRRLGASAPILAVRAAAVGASFLSVLIVAQAAGPEGRGAVAAFAILLFFGALGAGSGTGAALYVQVARRRDAAPAYVGVLLAWSAVVFTAALGASALVLWLGWLTAWIPGADIGLLVLIAVGAACQYVAMSAIQVLMGLGRGVATAIAFGVVPFAMLAGNLTAASFTSEARAFITVQLLAWLAGAVLLLAIIGVRPTFSARAIREILASGRRGWLGDLANALSYRLDTLLLGLISGVFAVGIYSFAVQVLEPVWILATAVSSGLLVEAGPGVAEAERQRKTIRASVLVTVGAGLGLAVILVAMPIIVALIGREFDSAVVPAVLLAPGIMFLSASKILAAYQLSHGRLWLGSVVAGTSLVTTTILDLLLMPTLGPSGASLASTVGYGVSAALWILLFHRYRPSPRAAGAVASG